MAIGLRKDRRAGAVRGVRLRSLREHDLERARTGRRDRLAARVGCQPVDEFERARERTKAKAARVLTIRPHHDRQAAARKQAATDPDWQAAYRRWRPPVERAVAWPVAAGNRRLRYRGTIANNTWIHTRAAALNLRTLLGLGLTRTNGHWSLPSPA